MSIKLAICFILFSTTILATTFLPTKIIDRMKNSDGLIMGQYTGHSYKKIATGDVVTEYTFTVQKFAGLTPNDILNKHAFKVIVPGGKWNGLNYKVSGAPSFMRDKDIVLMVRKGGFGYVLPDLAMSKFELIRKGPSKELVSNIYSHKDGIGKISLNDFNIITNEVFGHNLQKYEADKFVYHKPKLDSGKRSPASEEKVGESGDSDSSHTWRYFWLILGLGSIGSLGSWLNREMKD
jgi:hypothetical protein